MKNSKLLSLAFSVVLVCIAIQPCVARGKKKPTPAATVHRTMISAVTGNSVTVSDDKTAKTLTVNQFTEISVNGQKGTLADLKPGMVVNVVLGTSPTQASRITATSK
jgi:hypothetical protein